MADTNASTTLSTQRLHQFGIIDNPTCSCEETTETVAHYLLQCNNYEKETEMSRKKMRAKAMRVEKQLGYSHLIKHILTFVNDTKDSSSNIESKYIICYFSRTWKLKDIKVTTV